MDGVTQGSCFLLSMQKVSTRFCTWLYFTVSQNSLLFCHHSLNICPLMLLPFLIVYTFKSLTFSYLINSGRKLSAAGLFIIFSSSSLVSLAKVISEDLLCSFRSSLSCHLVHSRKEMERVTTLVTIGLKIQSCKKKAEKENCKKKPTKQQLPITLCKQHTDIMLHPQCVI